MDWMKGMQRAIDYIEANITAELRMIDIADRAYCSSFHFQRIFSLLTGITIGEYIRNRRLTLAGSELNQCGSKVIDAALKYGYESPESFTKAFTRFHGITPSAAREPEAKLRSYSRLSIKLIMEGGDIMDYRIVKRNAFTVAAKSGQFSTETDSNWKELPKFWTQCYTDGSIDTLCGLALTMDEPVETGRGLLGICDSGNCPEDAALFRYSIGVESSVARAPEGYSLITIPQMTWAIFTCVGAMPDAIQKLWKRVYSEFFPQSDYEQVGGLDFEFYPEGDNSKPDYISEIWIPVKRK